MIINCLDDIEEKEEENKYEDDVVVYRDSHTNKIVTTTFCEMRGIVDNYSNPISSTLAKLYEALLVKAYKNINMEILQDIRGYLGEQRNQTIDDGYYEMIERYEKLSSKSLSENLADNLERTLFDIQEKSVDNMVIYEDLSQITSMDVSLLANFSREMAEIEMEYLFSDLNYPERMGKFTEIINEYTEKMNKHLVKQNINVANFAYMDAKMYLKCVY